MFSTTELTLSYVLPRAVKDINTWFDYFIKKDALYDLMFFLMFLLIYWSTIKFAKALSLFAIFLSGGSFVDKQIFGINQYVYSDIALIIIGISVSLYMYFKRWKI